MTRKNYTQSQNWQHLTANSLLTAFNIDELKAICFDLEIDYEHFPLVPKEQFVIELIFFCQRHGLSQDLVNFCRKKRPKIQWFDTENHDLAQKEKEILTEIPFSSSIVFSEWDSAKFQREFEKAETLSMVATDAIAFLNSNFHRIKQFLDKGGTLEMIIVEPSGVAVKMEGMRSPGRIDSDQADIISQQINLAVHLLRDIVHATTKETISITIKTMDILPSAVITIINKELPTALMFVTLGGFGEAYPTRPSFILNHSHGRWFDFYLNSFKNMWESDFAKNINIGG